jgi:protein TonB
MGLAYDTGGAPAPEGTALVVGRRAFGAYTTDERTPRQWLASVAASAAIYAGLVALVIVIGSATKKMVEEQAVDLKFVEKVIEEPPPPPPPPVEAKVEPPPAAAPVVRPDQKIRRLDKPPPPKELVAPKEMPTAAPQEADPSQDKGIAVYGEGEGDPAGLEGGTAGGKVGGSAIALPEDADPPTPSDGNRVPTYPQEARAAGRTGMVVLKVVIRADGSVAQVEVLRGEEPFVAAALAAVKTWKYAPARYKGQPITVYRIIQIPFKLTA